MEEVNESGLEKLPLDEAVEKETHLREGNISLILEGYDDIFSDFDPRSYSERALSDDFLSECRKAARDKNEREIELRLMVPKEKRDHEEELKIKHRLKNHFHKHFQEWEGEVRKVKRQGWQWFGLGAICMLIGAYLYTHASSGVFGLTEENFLYHLLIVMFEPAGWFLVWEGMEQILMGAKENERELQFYKKMASIHVEFYAY